MMRSRQGPGVWVALALIAASAVMIDTGCAKFSRARTFALPPDQSPTAYTTPLLTEGSPTVLLASQRHTPVERRIVVYSAAYLIMVRDPDDAIESMERIAADLGGYVQEIDDWRVAIRVPAEAYTEAIKRVEGLGEVSNRSQEALDVTEEYVDLEARLHNALAVRERLEALLARAEDVKAALEVEKELKRLGEEIETLQAKLELLKQRVAYSTIDVQFDRLARKAAAPMGMKQLPFAWLRELDPSRLLR